MFWSGGRAQVSWDKLEDGAEFLIYAVALGQGLTGLEGNPCTWKEVSRGMV
jgi:hypothetical protein